jgi:GR25 family glycosyltransferase involved in LPS biosynthesis
MSSYSAHLITHNRSRYDYSALLNDVDHVLTRGGGKKTNVHSADKFALADISSLDALAFKLASAVVSFMWSRHLERATVSGSLRRLSGFRDALDFLSRVARISLMVNSRNLLQARIACLRSLNISYSHLGAWESAASSGSRFALVLEDDGILSSRGDLEATLDFIATFAKEERETLINISQSFKFYTLGVNHIVLSSSSEKVGQTSQEVIFSNSPFTNTLCATVLSVPLVRSLISFTERSMKSKLWRSVAIDFQVNRYIMEHAKARALECAHLSPGIINQGSMLKTASNRI